MGEPRGQDRYRSVAGALAMSLVLCASAPAWGADLYGLTVGIDDYEGTVNDLDGAVNDAKDVSQALDRAGAREVVRLFNDDASKAAITAAWERLVAKAKPGDTIVFSYAGHGGQEPAPPDRHDKTTIESFLLGHFEPSGPGTRERIVDDEVFTWLQAADKKGIKVIFVADSCHSGGMERSASAPGVKFRRMTYPAITDDQLKFPPPEAAQITVDDFQNVTFVAAVAADKLVPEVTIEGQKRGALSWAFSRAVEGRADKNGDGEVSEFELLGYIVPAVHSLVESQQTPQVLPLRARSVALVTLRGGGGQAGAPAGAQGEAPADEGALKLKLAVEGGDASAVADLPFVTVVADKAQADLIWSADGKVEHVVGGVVAENVDAQGIKGVVSKWAALKWLNHQAALSPIPAKLVGGNQRYAIGDVVEVEIEGAKYPHLTLFNLPPDGRVEFYVPDPGKPGDATKDWSREPMHETFKVDKPPYGAEHMVAIFSKNDLPDLHAALSSMTTPQRAEALRPMLEEALRGEEAQIGIIDIYTGAGG
ncbi:MAG: caspase family protein [Methyloceanibacter sp.]|nr:caspase family protein [Methyloceanibacter sp.]